MISTGRSIIFKLNFFLNKNFSLVKLNTIKERVKFWDFIALSQHRQKNDEIKKLEKKELMKTNFIEDVYPILL